MDSPSHCQVGKDVERREMDGQFLDAGICNSFSQDNICSLHPPCSSIFPLSHRSHLEAKDRPRQRRINNVDLAGMELVVMVGGREFTGHQVLGS